MEDGDPGAASRIASWLAATFPGSSLEALWSPKEASERLAGIGGPSRDFQRARGHSPAPPVPPVAKAGLARP
jgi:hypothetical protein